MSREWVPQALPAVNSFSVTSYAGAWQSPPLPFALAGGPTGVAGEDEASATRSLQNLAKSLKKNCKTSGF